MLRLVRCVRVSCSQIRLGSFFFAATLMQSTGLVAKAVYLPSGEIVVVSTENNDQCSQQQVIAIDPTTGDRTTISNPTYGTGPILQGMFSSIAVASGSNLGTSFYIPIDFEIDPVSGDRQILSDETHESGSLQQPECGGNTAVDSLGMPTSLARIPQQVFLGIASLDPFQAHHMSEMSAQGVGHLIYSAVG